MIKGKRVETVNKYDIYNVNGKFWVTLNKIVKHEATTLKAARTWANAN